MGHLDEYPLQPGINFMVPFVTKIRTMSVRQQNAEVVAECYSKDMQQVSLRLNVLYSIPDGSVIRVFRDYSGDPFNTLIAPRVQEAIKEVTAMDTAEDLVKNRESNKVKALDAARKKVGEILVLDDIVISNVDLSNDLEKAIEEKMVAEQDARKAVFVKQKAQQEMEAALIRAEGEAKAIKIKGDALQQNPRLIELEMVNKWNGVSPTIVGAGQGIMLPIQK
jgi:prohibitin 2